MYSSGIAWFMHILFEIVISISGFVICFDLTG